MSLLTSSEKTAFGAIYQDMFDTFKRQIVIHKQPIKNVTYQNSSSMFGYPGDTNPVAVTYTSVTGVFDARIIYGNQRDDDVKIPATETKNPFEGARIRVELNCKNFIMSGKTEKITFDNKTWNSDYGYTVRHYIDTSYYEFQLKETI